jgi:hypothetical protein
VEGQFDIPTFVYDFQSMLFHWQLLVLEHVLPA